MTHNFLNIYQQKMFWAEVCRENKTHFEWPVHFLQEAYIFLDNKKMKKCIRIVMLCIHFFTGFVIVFVAFMSRMYFESLNQENTIY
jgi:hypothetical protein